MPSGVPTGWLAVLLAPFIGSFLGVIIRRLPRSEPIMLGRSCCEHCRTPLRPHELVPLLSYLVQHGRCRSCGDRIAPFHPLIELCATLVALVAVAIAGADNPFLWGDVVLGWTLLALAWIDAETWRLPDILTLPLLLAGLGEALLLQDSALLETRLAAAILGWLGLTAVRMLYRLIRGRAGLGAGDPKLFAAGGAWTGLAELPDILLVAALLGLLGALFMASRGRRLSAGMALPFGPGLAGAIWLVRLMAQCLVFTQQQ